MKRFVLTFEGTDYPVEVSKDMVIVNGRPFHVKLAGQKVTVDGIEYGIEVEQNTAWINGYPYPFVLRIDQPGAVRRKQQATRDTRHQTQTTQQAFSVPHPVSHAALPTTHAGHTVKAVMPGKVLRVLVKEGEAIQSGHVVCVLEAMKMENELRAQEGGMVQKVLVRPGQGVEAGEPLVILGQPAEM